MKLFYFVIRTYNNFYNFFYAFCFKINIMDKPKDRRLVQFGAHVKAIREGLKLSQDQVAANSNLTKSNISMIENGYRNLAFTTLLDLAKGLGKHPKDLLDLYFTEDKK
jgi:DNA-binding XRE family transcriptional regulator